MDEQTAAKLMELLNEINETIYTRFGGAPETIEQYREILSEIEDINDKARDIVMSYLAAIKTDAGI